MPTAAASASAGPSPAVGAAQLAGSTLVSGALILALVQARAAGAPLTKLLKITAGVHLAVASFDVVASIVGRSPSSLQWRWSDHVGDVAQLASTAAAPVAVILASAASAIQARTYLDALGHEVDRAHGASIADPDLDLEVPATRMHAAIHKPANSSVPARPACRLAPWIPSARALAATTAVVAAAVIAAHGLTALVSLAPMVHTAATPSGTLVAAFTAGYTVASLTAVVLTHGVILSHRLAWFVRAAAARAAAGELSTPCGSPARVAPHDRVLRVSQHQLPMQYQHQDSAAAALMATQAATPGRGQHWTAVDTLQGDNMSDKDIGDDALIDQQAMVPMGPLACVSVCLHKMAVGTALIAMVVASCLAAKAWWCATPVATSTSTDVMLALGLCRVAWTVLAILAILAWTSATIVPALHDTILRQDMALGVPVRVRTYIPRGHEHAPALHLDELAEVRSIETTYLHHLQAQQQHQQQSSDVPAKATPPLAPMAAPVVVPTAPANPAPTPTTAATGTGAPSKSVVRVAAPFRWTAVDTLQGDNMSDKDIGDDALIDQQAMVPMGPLACVSVCLHKMAVGTALIAMVVASCLAAKAWWCATPVATSTSTDVMLALGLCRVAWTVLAILAILAWTSATIVPALHDTILRQDMALGVPVRVRTYIPRGHEHAPALHLDELAEVRSIETTYLHHLQAQQQHQQQSSYPKSSAAVQDMHEGDSGDSANAASMPRGPA
ncbi:hypothetical protein AMAG_05325 [Allomyces macrogynus ATCC 38327]|uniref:Uncharacterized protein n=1 Tax=Allomyces macrogynus (strain ATCC 38327) TaxID=578462 RepID=A0A0L0SBQ4_ALLM3|nr:hypothetical protein AMAG_05325 [Allomyces macrogynus ATCC 38327]|eukprot:KNE59872.1 hypothetical protein AMAG_05325 [Allomyces macrogynus ATCC 38327]